MVYGQKIEKYYLLNEAYSVLCNPKEREKYDTWRNSGLSISFNIWKNIDEEKRNSYHWKTSNEQPTIEDVPTSNKLNNQWTDKKKPSFL